MVNQDAYKNETKTFYETKEQCVLYMNEDFHMKAFNIHSELYQAAWLTNGRPEKM